MNKLLEAFEKHGIYIDLHIIAQVKTRLYLGYPYSGGVCLSIKWASELFDKDIHAFELMRNFINAREAYGGYLDIADDVWYIMPAEEKSHIREKRVQLIVEALDEYISE